MMSVRTIYSNYNAVPILGEEAANMESGVLRLKTLYDFIEKNKSEMTDGNVIPSAYQIKSTLLGRKYSEECGLLVCPKTGKQVPDEQGFYLYGFYNSQKFWINIYVGKAGKGKTASLRVRISDELKKERAFIWRAYFKREEVLRFDYPKYQSEVARAFHKAGSTHVFWVATPELQPEIVEPVENDLIEAMNPTGNRRRITPSATLRREAGAIFDAFREMVHDPQNRNSKFHLTFHDEFWKWVGESEPSTP
jgi:hypothetical protein